MTRNTHAKLLVFGVVFTASSSFSGNAQTDRSEPERQAIEQAAKLADEANKRDRLLWNREIEAQDHEEVISKMWDSLRTAPDPFVVLRDFPFRAMRVGKIGKPAAIENGVFVTKFAPAPGAAGSFIDRNKWSGLLAGVRNKGFKIVQSEWHHSRFVPGSEAQPAQSEVAFELHLEKPAPPAHALIVKGTLGLTWKHPNKRANSANPEIDVIDASRITLVEREGAQGFERALRIAPEPEEKGGAVEVTPLMVYDLDRDGLPEIVLGSINTVMRNRGSFQFEREALMPGDGSLRNAANIADFDGDGLVDLLGVKPDGSSVIVKGDKNGRFTGAQAKPWDAVTKHASAMTCGDVDGDGDLDVWLSQYRPPYMRGQMPTPFYDANDGFPSYLLINDGKGNFTDRTEAAGLAPKRNRRTYSNSLVDFDDDGDLDLVVVSDFSGLDIHRNDGKGKFAEATKAFVGEHSAFGMSHTFGDFDLDGKLDFYMAGMSSTTARRLDRLGLARSDFPGYTKMRKLMTFGNRLYQRRDGSYVQTKLNDNAARLGWAWGCSAADFDNDGDDDLYVANGHISGKSSTDYCTRYWCHDIYTGSSEERLDIAHLLTDTFRPERMQGLHSGGISWNGYEKNRLLMNLSGKDFVDVGFLMGAGFRDDCRSVVAADFDADGKQDLAVVAHGWQPGSEIIPKHSLYLLRNRFAKKSWIGVHLDTAGKKGRSPVGARVVLEGSFGSREWKYMTGDSFYAQHPATAHFGIKAGDHIDRIRVEWPDGKQTTVQTPQPGKYHQVTP